MVSGEVSTIEIQRDQADLGISVVGGCDTPLVSFVVCIKIVYVCDIRDQ